MVVAAWNNTLTFLTFTLVSSEHFLALLATLSVLCRGKFGERFENMKVDQWHDSVLNITVQHQQPSQVLEVEPHEVFADLFPYLTSELP